VCTLYGVGLRFPLCGSAEKRGAMPHATPCGESVRRPPTLRDLPQRSRRSRAWGYAKSSEYERVLWLSCGPLAKTAFDPKRSTRRQGRRQINLSHEQKNAILFSLPP